MTQSIIHTPFDFSEPVKAGRRRFWKQVLPVTEIDYNGRPVKFDEEFHKSLELSYEGGVYDQIPLVFADGDNKHNEDPRNFGGEVVHMENRGKDGTWALIEADRAAAKAIQKNPKLGVSARIVDGVEKAGKTFGPAVRHVLMTMFPRVQGMQPWQSVDLSDEDADVTVVDLSALTYEEGTAVATKKLKRTADGKIDLSALSDDEFNKLLDLAAEAEEDEDLDEDLDEDKDLEVEAPPAGKKRRHKSKTKITVEKDSEDDEDDDEDDDLDENTDLSDDVLRRNEVSQFQAMRLDLAESKWNSRRDAYAKAGVPPFLLDLAEPVLKQPDSMTIDLSDDEQVDATAIIGKMLDGVKGIIDLTGELGHQMDLSDADKQSSTDDMLAAWDKQYG